MCMICAFRCSAELIGIPVNSEALHAVLRLCLRCTRHYRMAELFVSYNGIEKLLALGQQSSFSGSTSIISLLIRHILEDESTLRLSLEKVIREYAAGIGSNFCGVSSSSMGCKEMNYVLRQLGPAMCRDANLFKSAATDLLKITLRNGKEPPWSAQYTVDLLAAEAEKNSSTVPQASDTFKRIIVCLLNALIQPYTKEKISATTPNTEGQSTSNTKNTSTSSTNNLQSKQTSGKAGNYQTTIICLPTLDHPICSGIIKPVIH